MRALDAMYADTLRGIRDVGEGISVRRLAQQQDQDQDQDQDQQPDPDVTGIRARIAAESAASAARRAELDRLEAEHRRELSRMTQEFEIVRNDDDGTEI
jgi:hypothetical protein